jgi:hypothetical protein
MILAWFLGMGCYICSFVGTFVIVPFASSSGTSQPIDMFILIPILVIGAIFVGGFAFVIYGVIGAIMAFPGKPFQYVIIGRRVERFMQTGRDV